MRTPNVGRKRKRVVIQALNPSRDGYNEQDPTAWVDVETRWAEVIPLSGREFWAAKSVQADTTHQVKLRYVSYLTPRHRLKLGSRILNISDVNDTEERHRETVATCKEVS